MHILLINNNPVISRLLSLCTRDENTFLDEMSTLKMESSKGYDIIFVDEESYTQDTSKWIDRCTPRHKKVLLYTNESEMGTFDIKIQKPCLPSQIIELIDTVAVNNTEFNKDKNKGFIFPLSHDEIIDEEEPTKVLDANEVEKIKELLVMDDENFVEVLSPEEIEQRKVELIKEQLIADGLEIVEEDKLAETLSDNKVIADESLVIVDATLTKKSKKKKKKSISFNEEELGRIEDAVEVAIASLKKKQMKKLLKGKKVDLMIQLKDKQ